MYCSKIGVAALCVTITQGCSNSTYPMDTDRKSPKSTECNHVVQSSKQDSSSLRQNKCKVFFTRAMKVFKRKQSHSKNLAARNNSDLLDDEESTADTGLESDCAPLLSID
ncbi:MAG: hypothetical protein K2X94_02615 [Amoebophilaceae bacterium]|nr:hypothetical protein [Amoebophilaceae bacterium]